MLIDKARSFIQTMYSELKYNTNEVENRMKEIEQEINLTGSYTHTYEELSYGAKMAWRNSNRCIGRLFWGSLNVKDARDVCDEKEFIKFIHILKKLLTVEKSNHILQFLVLKIHLKFIIIS